MRKIVIAGGTGFIGKYVKTKFEQLGYSVILISRQKGFVTWDDEDKIIKALNAGQTHYKEVGQGFTFVDKGLDLD